MKPLEKFLKKQTSQLAGRAVPGGPGGGPGAGAGTGGVGGGGPAAGAPRPLQRRQSVSRLLLPAFLREAPAEPGLEPPPPEDDEAGEPPAGVAEEPGRGAPCWLQLDEGPAPGPLGGGGPLRSPSSYSSDELSPGEPLTSPPWAPLGGPERPEHLLNRVLERLAGGAARESGGASGKDQALCLSLLSHLPDRSWGRGGGWGPPQARLGALGWHVTLVPS